MPGYCLDPRFGLSRVALLIAAVLLLASCTGPSAPVTLTPEPTVQTALPDLVPERLVVELETGGACSFTSTRLGTRVTISNVGEGVAGPFVVDLNRDRQGVYQVLASGASVTLWFPGYSTSTQVFVDATSEVRETDESNNRVSVILPIPTLPPTCTPTPSSKATPRATPASATPSPTARAPVSS